MNHPTRPCHCRIGIKYFQLLVRKGMSDLTLEEKMPSGGKMFRRPRSFQNACIKSGAEIAPSSRKSSWGEVVLSSPSGRGARRRRDDKLEEVLDRLIPTLHRSNYTSCIRRNHGDRFLPNRELAKTSFEIQLALQRRTPF